MQFANVTLKSGLTFSYQNGRETKHHAILESLGGGVAILDYDRDGLPDLCFPGGGQLGPAPTITGLPTRLFRSVKPLQFEDVSRAADVELSRFYTHGIAVGDLDNDGFPDLLITGYGGLQLFRNQGDGTFIEESLRAGVTDTRWSSSAAFSDFNGDGNLDFYVAHYVDWSWNNDPLCSHGPNRVRDVCSPRDFNAQPHILYFSRGNGTFEDGSQLAQLVSDGKGLGVIAADIDSDNDVDIYVANDTTNNLLYVNNGTGQFQESGFVSGTAVDHRGIPNGSMGIAVFDFNRDLTADIWVTNYENETFALYRNEKEASFVCVSESAGITALEKLLVGFGTIAGDLDHDGDEDIAVTNGHVMYYSENSTWPQESIVLANDGRGRFQRQKFAPNHFLSEKHVGRGLVAGDLDRDGDLDLVFALCNEPSVVLENTLPTSDSSLVVRLVGTHSNRDAIGARVVLHTSHGDYLRLVCGGGSYLSQNDFELHWGVPAGSTIQGLTIHWPNGVQQESPAPSSRRVMIVEK
jgi:hypothetical protein